MGCTTSTETRCASLALVVTASPTCSWEPPQPKVVPSFTQPRRRRVFSEFQSGGPKERPTGRCLWLRECLIKYTWARQIARSAGRTRGNQSASGWVPITATQR